MEREPFTRYSGRDFPLTGVILLHSITIQGLFLVQAEGRGGGDLTLSPGISYHIITRV
jgi:hypothetical protein